MDPSLKRKRDELQEPGQPHLSKASRPDLHYGIAYDVPQHARHGAHHAAADPIQPHNRHLQIDYLARQQTSDISLVDPNVDTLSACATLIHQYSSVLERSESLANNLGARPLSSILLQRFERMFDGPPLVISSHDEPHATPLPSLSWLDVAHASQNPTNIHEFEDAAENKRVVQFEAKRCTVQVGWEEWQMVRSGLLQKMMPSQPVAEDEDRELGTLDILEETVSRVVALADQVAARGRQFNHRLKARRHAIAEKRQVDTLDINGVTTASASPHTRQELTRLFTSNRQHLSQTPASQVPPTTPTTTLHSSTQQAHATPNTSTNTPNSAPRARRPPPPPAPDGPYKSLMTSRMEMLHKGAQIYPPCDRCRRLRIDCAKNLTACVGCTKKHCKCAWRDVNGDEITKGGIVSQGNGVLTVLEPMGTEAGFEGIETPVQPGGMEGVESRVQSEDGGDHSESADEMLEAAADAAARSTLQQWTTGGDGAGANGLRELQVTTAQEATMSPMASIGASALTMNGDDIKTSA